MLKRALAWSGALIVMAVTATLVILDISNSAVHRYWSRHSFTASVLSGLLVLLLTVLIVDRVTSIRKLRNQSRAIAAQAGVIVAQAKRAADAVGKAPPSAEDRQGASDELRTYTQMLLTSAPVLIEAKLPRRFLEAAQLVAAQLFRAARAAGSESTDDARRRLDHAMEELEAAAAPLLAVLNRQQRAALASDAVDSSPDAEARAGASEPQE
jgi:hypothetical protein